MSKIYPKWVIYDGSLKSINIKNHNFCYSGLNLTYEYSIWTVDLKALYHIIPHKDFLSYSTYEYSIVRLENQGSCTTISIRKNFLKLDN